MGGLKQLKAQKTKTRWSEKVNGPKVDGLKMGGSKVDGLKVYGSKMDGPRSVWWRKVDGLEPFKTSHFWADCSLLRDLRVKKSPNTIFGPEIHGLKPVGPAPAKFRNLRPDKDRKIFVIEDQLGWGLRKFKKSGTGSVWTVHFEPDAKPFYKIKTEFYDLGLVR